jgi:hypothetical protein
MQRRRDWKLKRAVWRVWLVGGLIVVKVWTDHFGGGEGWMDGGR